MKVVTNVYVNASARTVEWRCARAVPITSRRGRPICKHAPNPSPLCLASVQLSYRPIAVVASALADSHTRLTCSDDHQGDNGTME